MFAWIGYIVCPLEGSEVDCFFFFGMNINWDPHQNIEWPKRSTKFNKTSK